MEKVIRMCEMTGKRTIVAEGLTTLESMQLIKKLAQEDAFGCYYRVVL